MSDKEVSSWAIKIQLDCYKDVIATVISTLVFTYWRTRWRICALENWDCWCWFFYLLLKGRSCTHKVIAAQAKQLSPSTETRPWHHTSVGDQRVTWAEGNPVAIFPLTVLIVSSYMNDFVRNGFPWISSSWADPITCWIWCPEARISTAELPVMKEALACLLPV